jgi:exodeoxyribonuclease V beta subunit
MQKEPEFRLSDILVVTFTRAAVRELKARVRTNLATLEQLLEGERGPLPPYLEIDPDRIHSRHNYRAALAGFDQAQIFTLHSFCLRMLKEFPLESGVSLQLQDNPSVPLETAFQDLFESQALGTVVCPEQLRIAVLDAKGIGSLARRIARRETRDGIASFSDFVERFRTLVLSWPVFERDRLWADFQALRVNYKAEVKGRFEEQIDALVHAQQDPAAALQRLIAQRGSLFQFLSSSNQKVRTSPVSGLHYPGLLERVSEEVVPILQEACDPQKISWAISSVWEPIAERIAREEGGWGHDEILHIMGQAIERPDLQEAIRRRYKAVIIDEFQDTDPLQWSIFRTLFLHRTQALFLIGDPKQSIYRFRRADLYTYLAAKEAIDPSRHYCLDTNYRSSPSLLQILNRLFDREWLQLPKANKVLPYLPVRAGKTGESLFSDGKGAVVAFEYGAEEIDSAYRYAAVEILRLREEAGSFSSFALLVKDRYAARRAQQILSEAGIPAVTKSQEPLSETLACEALGELMEALLDPNDLAKVRTVLAGPLAGLSAEEVKSGTSAPLLFLRETLEKEGVTALFCELLRTKMGARTVYEEIATRGPSFEADWRQVVELVLRWSGQTGFTLKGALRYLDSLSHLDSEQAICRWREGSGDSVQIMTMHVSKGLEFEVVFAFGVGARTPASDEEADAEKLRQLYVAWTRAKRRLYIPFPRFAEVARSGEAAPLEIFAAAFSGQNLREQLEEQGVKFDHAPSVSSPIAAAIHRPTFPAIAPPPLPKPSPPAHILSFTALARPQEAAPLGEQKNLDIRSPHTLPRGPEVGVAIHTVFERCFQEGIENLSRIVSDTLRFMLEEWADVVSEIVTTTLQLQLPAGFSLADLDRKQLLTEAEFCFSRSPDLVKGYIDLIFEHEKKIYFVDWKTNWLGNGSADYSQERMQEAIAIHQYNLQASLYREALEKAFGSDLCFGGAFYLFVRGPGVVWLQ